jgi:hypothetical protein
MEPIGYEKSPEQLDATFAALADPTRRTILARLIEGEASVTELARPFAMSQPDDVDINEIVLRPTSQEF